MAQKRYDFKCECGIIFPIVWAEGDAAEKVFVCPCCGQRARLEYKVSDIMETIVCQGVILETIKRWGARRQDD